MTLTQDLDILISIADLERHPSGLVTLAPIEKALQDMGYAERSDVGVLVEGWPVQFIPASSDLDEEALREAVEVVLGGPTQAVARVLKAEHIVAKAVSVGRLKDLARVEAFLDQDVVDLAALKAVIERFKLQAAWAAFCLKAGRPDPLDLG